MSAGSSSKERKPTTDKKTGSYVADLPNIELIKKSIGDSYKPDTKNILTIRETVEKNGKQSKQRTGEKS